MRRILLYTFFIITFCSNVFAQAPTLKKWDYRYGGSNNDWFSIFQQTKDTGFILGGFSMSGINGDKSQPNWDITLATYDYWIVKLDSNGIKQWDKTFGGTNSDLLYSLQQTSDGGYILGGISRSPISGDKTDSSRGGYDYWIVKIDSLGIKQWDKTYGGASDDELYSLQQTSDGGYILGGFSNSDSSGEKTQHNWDPTLATYDYWIVKVDSIGTKQWDKRFGGTAADLLYSLKQTSDGGYILGGSSRSSISGDKTEPCWGYYDYWVVKIDSLGIKQWDKRLGGIGDDELQSVEVTSNGDFFILGNSSSGISGDKTQPTWGLNDFWIVKTDSHGTKLLDKDFGGTNNEELFHMFHASDNGYLFSGDSYSNESGDKKENNLGPEQTWIVKTDSLLNMQWDKTIFTTGHDESGEAIQTSDHCYVISNFTNAGIGGYKSQTSQGGCDYWIVKLCDSLATDGINFSTNSAYVSIFTNPFISIFTVNISQQNLKHCSFIIHNTLGQIILNKQENIINNVFSKSIDMSEFAEGIYLLEMIIDGERITKKIIKNE